MSDEVVAAELTVVELTVVELTVVELTVAELTVAELLQGPGRAAIEARLQRLERGLQAVRERPMRRTVVTTVVSALEGAELVAFLGLLLERNLQGQGTARAVMQELALEPTVFEEMSYAQSQAAYHLARAAGLEPIARMFIRATGNENPTLDEAFTGNDHLDIPLGTRRTAARSRDRFTLDRLLHDRDQRVIAILLDNPRIIERDVVTIAAMRPTRPELLTVVARHPRWSSRVAVRRALVANPYTPAPIARRLLPTMLQQDLRELVFAGVLRGDLQALARSLVQRPAQTFTLEEGEPNDAG